MMKKLIGALFALLIGAPSYGQSVQQSGPVTRNHLPYWVSPGVIADAGTSADSPISSIGSTGPICANSARISSGAWQQLCLQANTNSPATISLQNFGTAPAETLNFIINGTTFPFPGALASMIVGSTPVLSGINGDCLFNNNGVLGNLSCSLLTSPTTGTGSIVFNTSPTLAGTIGGNFSFSGNLTFVGSDTFGSNVLVNGTATPASSAGQTVILGTVSAPTLTNNGQGFLFNTSIGGAALQGAGSTSDVTLLNKNGGTAMSVPTGVAGVSFPGSINISGLSSGTCANSVVLNSSNQAILGSCPGSASSIQVGSTTVSSGTTGYLLYNNGGTLGNENIVSVLTAGTGISITGTTNATIINSGVVTVKKQVFTSTGTYTPSSGMLFALIECQGSGGAGGGANGNTTIVSAAAGGGSGGYSRVLVSAATVGASQTVTVGAAGVPGTAGNNPGGAGGAVSVGSLCVANGGGGGSGNGNSQPAAAAGGVGGTAGTGDVAVVGNSGGSAYGLTTTQAGISGYGAPSYFGGGVAGVVEAGSACSSGNAGGNYGAGGSGAICNNTATPTAGSAGAKGVVYITEYNSQ